MTVERGLPSLRLGGIDVFGELLTAVDPDLHIEVISKNEKFTGPVHEVNICLCLS